MIDFAGIGWFERGHFHSRGNAFLFSSLCLLRLIEYELIVFAVCYAIVSLLLDFLIGPVLDDDHAYSRIQLVIFNLLIEDVL